jgi:hypothetical protein
MNRIRTCAVVLCAAILWATGTGAQKWNPCDPRYYFITPADCTTYGEQAAKAILCGHHDPFPSSNSCS